MNLELPKTGTSNTDVWSSDNPVPIGSQMSTAVLILVGGALSVPGTSSAEQDRLWEAFSVPAEEITTSSLGPDFLRSSKRNLDSTSVAINELRRISGLTWQQLGELFGVSRRSVHFWASGKPLSSTNEERVARTLDVVRTADRGTARSTRAALLTVQNGTSALSLLADQEFELAQAFLGSGARQARPRLARLSNQAKEAREPHSPHTLIDAKSDRIHLDPAKGRAANSVRNKRRGGS